MKQSKPVFGTQEWASKNANFINGCLHDCKYCYAKSMAVRFKRKTPESWKVEDVNRKRFKQKHTKTSGYIMFPSSHDITPEHLEYSLNFLQSLLCAGNDVLIVTKPHLVVVQQICERFSDSRNSILFRFTIGSCDTETLKFWEPNAPSYEERYQSLKYAYDNGYKTSVSCEPMLDTNMHQLIEEIEPFVTDSIWLGKPNGLLARLKMNGNTDPETIQQAEKLIADFSDDWIRELYETYKDNPKIKWKESVKKVMKIEISTTFGLDI